VNKAYEIAAYITFIITTTVTFTLYDSDLPASRQACNLIFEILCFIDDLKLSRRLNSIKSSRATSHVSSLQKHNFHS
jgi:hypothetical protein